MISSKDDPVRVAYAPDEAADMLGISHNTMRNWIREEKVPTFKIGRRRFIRRDDFDALTERTSFAATRRGGVA